jgi:hypothetical protein
VSRASTINAVRGDTPSILVIDEAAFISTSRTRRRIKQGSDLAAELYYAADAALNLGGKCIIISTPNGIGNFFERTFTRAKLKNNEFHAIELNWWQRPEYATNLRKKPGCGYPEDYTSDWLEKKIATCDDYNIQILQETFAQFLGSGKTVLSFDYLKTLVSTPPKQIALGGALRIFQDPDPKFKYVMGVDTAQGDGTDFNTVQVFNAYTKEQVAEYFSKVDNIEFVKHIVNISNLYFNPVINVESNGIGFSTANGLRSKGVNLYKVKNKVGTMMTGQMRDMIVSLYKDMPQLNLKLNSDLLIHQMHTFVWLNGRADHETGCNDDLLFAMMLAILIIDKGKTMDIGKFLYKDEKNLITKTRIEMEDLDKYMAKQNEKVRIEHKYTKALNFGLDTKYIEEYEMLFGK